MCNWSVKNVSCHHCELDKNNNGNLSLSSSFILPPNNAIELIQVFLRVAHVFVYVLVYEQVSYMWCLPLFLLPAPPLLDSTDISEGAIVAMNTWASEDTAFCANSYGHWCMESLRWQSYTILFAKWRKVSLCSSGLLSTSVYQNGVGV